MSNAVTFALTQSDLWTVGVFGHRRDVAVYSAAFRLSTLVMVPATVVTFVVSPFIVDLIAKGERARLQRLLRTVAAVAGLPSLLILTVMAVAGGSVVGLVFGDFYRRSGAVLALLTIGKIATVLTGACGVALIMGGHQRAHLGCVATSLVVTVPAQALAYETHGLAGLAIATSAGLVLQNVLLLLAARRLIGIWTHFGPRTALRSLAEVRSAGSIRKGLGLRGRG
jgi:O-antigen/teichoic acid export membrane protein